MHKAKVITIFFKFKGNGKFLVTFMRLPKASHYFRFTVNIIYLIMLAYDTKYLFNLIKH